MNEDKRADGKGIFVQKKTGYIILPERDTIEPYHVELGGGSAYGGRYKPAKPEDERFVGKPGEIKITYAKDGSKIETHIGPNGLADKEQHHNGRPNPHTHSNPHDHEINFEGPIANKPNFGPPINYWDGVPEFVGKSGGSLKHCDLSTIPKRAHENRPPHGSRKNGNTAYPGTPGVMR